MFRQWLLTPVVLLCVSITLSHAADTRVVIREWDVPTPNSRPHDPAVDPDGSLWFTGQLSNTLGRLNPKTGEIKEFPLKTQRSGPHGLVADKEGNIWYTGNFGAHIGKLNPKTGEVTEYRISDSRARDPHTPIFDQKGILWFTVQRGNFVGRLDPRTGAISLKESPTPRSLPYGIVVDSQGSPFFCEFGTNKIARVNPSTMEITEFALPEGARPRRIAVTPDDLVYYSDYARGYLGRLDPKTGKVEEWPSPGGAKSRPYGVTATSDGIVWYSESGVHPNTIVRFDPKRKSFQTWPIPSGGGVIRHMVATPEGNLYIAASGVNKVGVVEMTQP